MFLIYVTGNHNPVERNLRTCHSGRLQAGIQMVGRFMNRPYGMPDSGRVCTGVMVRTVNPCTPYNIYFIVIPAKAEIQ